MKKITLLLAFVLLFGGTLAHAQRRQPKPKPQVPKVCGDPTLQCVTDFNFQPYQLPLAVKDSGGPIQETAVFYAVVLKTQRTKEAECEKFIAEEERLAVQELFPRHKVFTDRCPEPGELYYTTFDYKTRILAIYAGRKAADATAILKQVKAKYPKAAIRPMRAGFNGT